MKRLLASQNCILNFCIWIIYLKLLYFIHLSIFILFLSICFIATIFAFHFIKWLQPIFPPNARFGIISHVFPLYLLNFLKKFSLLDLGISGNLL